MSHARPDARRLSVSTSNMALLQRGRQLLQLLFLFIVALHHCKALEEDAANNEDGRASERSLGRLSWHAREQLLQVMEQLGHITGDPVPIYRDDLPSDYVSYWSFEFSSKEYAIISSGPDTGDYGLAIQGALPSLVTLVNNTATGYGETCNRYFMFTPSGEMMCRSKSGDIVATSAEDRYYPHAKSGSSDHNHNDLESQMGDFVVLWKRRALQVQEEGVWADTTTGDTAKDDSFLEHFITPGDVIRLPVGSDTSAIHVAYVADSGEESNSAVKMMQQKLCSVLSSCAPDGMNNTAQDLNRAESLHGVPYLDTTINLDAYNVLGRTSLSMRVAVTSGSDTTVIRRYSLQLNARTRKRRRIETQPWSKNFAVTSIPDKDEFPNYEQHRITWNSAKKVYRMVQVAVNVGWTTHKEYRNMSMPVNIVVCDVGSGPVAWAQIFGYFDRRAHANARKYGAASQQIYRCGNFGTDGLPKCVAPAGGSTFRIRGYTNAIAKAMNSECANKDKSIGDISWTPVSKMPKAITFFKSMQKTGRPRLTSTKAVWKTAGNLSGMRNTMMALIHHGWPVIVGTKVSKKRHYAVVTAYRRKSRKVRECTGSGAWTCKKWTTQYSNHQMYTHQGDGTNGNRWRATDIHYLIAAKY